MTYRYVAIINFAGGSHSVQSNTLAYFESY